MNIKDEVIDCCKSIISEAGIDIEVDENTPISRENGIDSLGIVSLVLELEERFNCELDDYLGEIRRCKLIKDLISIIEKIIKEKNR